MKPTREGAPHILIVDDLPDHLAFAGTILRQQGYRVHVAASGVTALAFLEHHHPDLIVLDVHMEGMDGLELCRRIKSNELMKDIPVIFVTAETDSKVITQGFEAGCCDYVSKPFVRAEYLARISAHLRIAGQARELAAAYEELDHFCSAVSHDLRSPLGVVQMLLSALRQELGDNLAGEAIQIMDMLDEKASRLSEMVGRLLEFSRMCSIQPAFQPLPLKQMVEEVFEEQKLTQPDREVILICEELPTVQGDPVLIRLLLRNIINNAWKFTGKRKHATISVGATEQEDFTVIFIQDNGAGFDMRYADRLFGVFQRLHSDSEFQGTGVGLAMANRIMQRHGGYIRMEGEVDKGATVFLYFPHYQT